MAVGPCASIRVLLLPLFEPGVTLRGRPDDDCSVTLGDLPERLRLIGTGFEAFHLLEHVEVASRGHSRTSTGRSRCSIAHAVWYEPIFSAPCRLNADTPALFAANIQPAVIHTVSGERADVRTTSRPSPRSDVRSPRTGSHLRQPTTRPRARTAGTRSPSGHRSQSRPAASAAHQDWNSPIDRG